MRCGLFLLAVAVMSSAVAQLPPLRDSAVAITALVRQIDQRDTLWSTYWGSFSKEFTHKRALSVRLKIVGQFDPTVTISWAFVGSDTSDQNRFVVFAEGKKDTMIPRTGEMAFNVESPVFTGKDEKYVASGRRDREGIRPAGWAILIWQRGRFVAGQGSTPDMLAFARKNGTSPSNMKDEKKPQT